MNAPAVIDVTPVRIDGDGYRLPTDGNSITDEQQQLSRGTFRPAITDEREQLSRCSFTDAITVDPSKGLSRLQRQILGTAYTMNVYGTQVHAGNIPDYVTPLGIFVIFGIAPDIASKNARFSRTPQVASAQAALSRAATRLVERKLLAWRNYTHICPGGYVLTDAGRRIGASGPMPVLQIERCARYFGMTRLSRWHRDESGAWVSTPWMNGKGGGYEFELVYEDRDAIAAATQAAA